MSILSQNFLLISHIACIHVVGLFIVTCISFTDDGSTADEVLELLIVQVQDVFIFSNESPSLLSVKMKMNE